MPLAELTAKDDGSRGAHDSEKARVDGTGITVIGHFERFRKGEDFLGLTVALVKEKKQK